MIVAVDTNIWISALQFPRPSAPPSRAIARAVLEDVVVTCDEVNAEVLRTLTAKFGWPRHDAQIAIEEILLRAIRVTISGAVKLCRDPHDDMFLECAEVAEADFLVTGTKTCWCLAPISEPES